MSQSMMRRATRKLARDSAVHVQPKPEGWCALCMTWSGVENQMRMGVAPELQAVFIYGYILGRDGGEKRPICSRHRSVVERMRQVMNRRMG